jgi:hypothetical protein
MFNSTVFKKSLKDDGREFIVGAKFDIFAMGLQNECAGRSDPFERLAANVIVGDIFGTAKKWFLINQNDASVCRHQQHRSRRASTVHGTPDSFVFFKERRQ